MHATTVISAFAAESEPAAGFTKALIPGGGRVPGRGRVPRCRAVPRGCAVPGCGGVPRSGTVPGRGGVPRCRRVPRARTVPDGSGGVKTPARARVEPDPAVLLDLDVRRRVLDALVRGVDL